MILLWTTSTGQESISKSSKEYKNLVYQARQGLDAIDSLIIYKALLQKADTLLAAQDKEIIRKEGVIVRVIEQRNNISKERDNLILQISSLQATNIALADNVKRLGSRVKSFVIGPSTGYGYGLGSEAKRVPFIGVTLTYSLIKF